jgi:hypothetical protein
MVLRSEIDERAPCGELFQSLVQSQQGIGRPAEVGRCRDICRDAPGPAPRTVILRNHTIHRSPKSG